MCADSEFLIYIFLIRIFIVVVYIKQTNWWKLKMHLENLLTNVDKGKQVC